MSLLETWRETAYNTDGTTNANKWDAYLPKEQKIYEHILSEKLTRLEGTISELAERFDMSVLEIVGFFDGIHGALPSESAERLVLEDVAEDSFVSIDIDYEQLFKKMVEYRAEHLYTLPQWNEIFDKERRKELYTEQRQSSTIVKQKKIGRNDPCPCGSGKKYKKCCGE